MTVSEVTSSAASTGDADLEAAQEVAKADRFYNKLSNTGLQTFSSMHILDALRLRDAIKITYSDGKSISVGRIDDVAPMRAWSPCSRHKSLLKIIHSAFVAQRGRPCMLESHPANGC